MKGRSGAIDLKIMFVGLVILVKMTFNFQVILNDFLFILPFHVRRLKCLLCFFVCLILLALAQIAFLVILVEATLPKKLLNG